MQSLWLQFLAATTREHQSVVGQHVAGTWPARGRHAA